MAAKRSGKRLGIYSGILAAPMQTRRWKRGFYVGGNLWDVVAEEGLKLSALFAHYDIDGSCPW